MRVALYPVQFNPAKKTLKVFSDFQISVSFSNPTSPVNKELGIFRNMMHHVAINYELSGISASSKGFFIPSGNQLNKKNMVTSGSVNRVTNLDLLVDPNPMSVDYLVITHQSLFNSTNLTSLANHRSSNNKFDVVIVKVDDIYNNPKYPSSTTTRYISIRDFIGDVYANGTANHTYDGHLGYIVLVGDALQDDNSTKMVPAAYPDFYGTLEKAGDYYYACTGGDSDNLMDLMYGRISVGNDTELSNVVNKTIAYENSSSGSWRNNISFMSFSPWFFDDDADCDQEFKTMAQTIPRSYYISYAWRGFAADTAQAHGRQYFSHHFFDQESDVLIPDEADEMWQALHTGWKWYDTNYPPNERWRYGGAYGNPDSLCSSDLIDTWLYDKINAGQHTFIYEGHGRRGSLGASEGIPRTIFRVDEIQSELTNSNMYPFIISNCCETGWFDTNSADLGSVDCIGEAVVNLQNAGAIGFLGSTRDSNIGAFGIVDQRIIEAMHEDLSHVMGEAVMESKLNIYSQMYRRQYNLYGDPAVNLCPYGFTVSEDVTL